MTGVNKNFDGVERELVDFSTMMEIFSPKKLFYAGMAYETIKVFRRFIAK